MAPAAGREIGSNFRQRILSALVLGPLVLAAVYFGRPWLELVVAAAVAILVWEWTRLCQEGRFGMSGVILLFAALAFLTVASGWSNRTAVIGTALAGGAAAFGGPLLAGGRSPGFMLLGFGYIAIPCAALLWLRARPETGLDLVVLTMLATWAADSGAYLVGRAVGGPRLAPRISPKKTWSGFIGGLVVAAAVGGVYAIVRGGDPVAVAAVAMILGFFAAAGDLLESWVKRVFGAKDAGNLLPGHGGLLDRVDGLLLAAVAMAVLVICGWDLRA